MYIPWGLKYFFLIYLLYHHVGGYKDVWQPALKKTELWLERQSKKLKTLMSVIF